MEGNKSVRINNRMYDAATGMPLNDEPAVTQTAHSEAAEKKTTQATEVHETQQRSKTLHRRATKKPGLPARPQVGKHMDISRSPKVSRFAKTITPISEMKKPEAPDAPATIHPTVKRALAVVSQPQTVISATPQQIKNAAIDAALAPTPGAVKEKAPKGTSFFSRFRTKRYAIIGAVVLVLLIIGGVAYANLPTLSVSVAASQAGITATYPKYIPDGYRLSQPVTFKDGEVALTFKSNSGAGEYKVTQSRSTWNSTAVLDNVVRKAAGEDYVTNQERGLTIYSYDGNAAWVNAGILYTIDSSAPLSSDQIRRIATSLS